MKELVLIKLGGSVITNKSVDSTAHVSVIARLAAEIKKAQEKYKGRLVVGHGAGSFAHRPASKYQTKKGLINKNSLIGMSVVEDKARQLNAIVVGQFLTKKVSIFPFSPASFAFLDAKGGVKSYIDPLIGALDINAIPIVYGDVIMSKQTGFTIFSTEKVLSLIASKLRKDYRIRIVYVTDVNGVYDSKGKTILNITSSNFDQLKSAIAGAKNVDVTGGMLHKVDESLKIAKKLGIQTLIINGNKKGELVKAIVGTKTLGTTIS